MQREKYGARRIPGSIRNRLLLLMALLILPLNILVLVSTAQAIHVVQEQARTTLESAANLYIQQLDHRIASLHYYFFDLEETDVDFIHIASQVQGDAYYLSQTNLARKFSANIKTTAAADGYFYAAPERDDFLLVLPNRPTSEFDLPSQRSALSQVLERIQWAEKSRWDIVEAGGAQWLLRGYRSGSFYYGALISLDAVCAQIGQAVDFTGLQVVAGANTNTTALQKDNAAQIVATAHSKRAPVALQLTVPAQDIIRTLPLSQWCALALAVGYLCLLPVLFFGLNRMLLRPLDKIRQALLHVKSGERDYRISAHRYAREFQSINQSFNEMADNLETLQIENYEKELARKKMELRNLQLQIRPHFLLNTFHLIFSLAQLREFDSIQKLTLYLSNYFRYIFRSGKELEPLQSECDLIREYLDISAIRYPGSYEATYDLEEATMTALVPPLLIHNFVENIINHALLLGEVIHICVTARVENGTVEICVHDDGAGLDPQVVEKFNMGVFTTAQGDRIHVGITNSYQRIRHFYGEAGTLRVTSSPEDGTRFAICIPHRTEQEAQP